MGCGNKPQRRAGAGCATVNEVVIKHRRTGLLDDVLRSCLCMRMCVRFELEAAVIESVIKRWRAELLEVALQNCPCMQMCVRFELELAISYLWSKIIGTKSTLRTDGQSKWYAKNKHDRPMDKKVI